MHTNILDRKPQRARKNRSHNSNFLHLFFGIISLKSQRKWSTFELLKVCLLFNLTALLFWVGRGEADQPRPWTAAAALMIPPAQSDPPPAAGVTSARPSVMGRAPDHPLEDCASDEYHQTHEPLGHSFLILILVHSPFPIQHFIRKYTFLSSLIGGYF